MFSFSSPRVAGRFWFLKALRTLKIIFTATEYQVEHRLLRWILARDSYVELDDASDR